MRLRGQGIRGGTPPETLNTQAILYDVKFSRGVSFLIIDQGILAFEHVRYSSDSVYRVPAFFIKQGQGISRPGEGLLPLAAASSSPVLQFVKIWFKYLLGTYIGTGFLPTGYDSA